MCQCNVTVISSGYQCIGFSRALYNVTITGFMAGNIKDFTQISPKFDLQIATVHVCNQSCNTTFDSTNHDSDNNNDDDDNKNITSILAISVASCAMVLLCLILGVLVYRYVPTVLGSVYYVKVL